MSAPHSESYIDNEGEERCVTCDKWLERDYYTIEDHYRSILRSQLAVAEGKLAAIRALHRKVHVDAWRRPDDFRCMQCGYDWPCPTVAILDGTPEEGK